MASPWEKYAAPAEAGPWSKYGAKAPERKVSRVAAAGTGVEAGVGWGYRDEAEGGRAARYDLLPAWINSALDMQASGPFQAATGIADAALGLTVENDKRFKDTKARELYTKARDNRRSREEKARADHPLSYGTGEFTGAVVSTPLPGLGGAKVAATGAKATAAAAKRPILTSVSKGTGDVLKTVASGSTAGAAYGAVSGAGNAAGGVEERISGASSGAITGAAWGAALAPAARYVVAPVLAAAGRRLFTPADQQALRMVLKRMQRSGMSTDDARAKFDQWAKSGEVPETLAELMGPNEQGLLSALITANTETRSRAAETLLGRGTQEVDRLEKSFGKAMGAERGDFKAAKAEAARARAEDPEPFYTAAHFSSTGARRYLMPAMSRSLTDILKTSRRAQKSVRLASGYADDMQQTGTRAELDVLARWLEDGGTGQPPKISVQAADFIERQINRQYDRALTGQVEDVPAGIRTLRDAVRTVIDPSGIGKARETAAERIQRGKLLDEGRRFMNADRDVEDINNVLRGDPSLGIPPASPEGQQAFTIGAARAVSDKLRNTQDMKGFADATRQVARTPAIREKIDAVRPKVLTKKGKENKGARQTRMNRELDETIERTADRADFTNTMLGNSRTAFRQNEVAEAAAEDGMSGHLGDLIQDLIIAGPSAAGQSIWAKVGQGANTLVRRPGVLSPEINRAAADVLLASDEAIPQQLTRLSDRASQDAASRILPMTPQRVATAASGYYSGQEGALNDPYAQDFDQAYAGDTMEADDIVLSTFSQQTPERQAQIRAEYESLLPYMSPDEQAAVRRLLDGGGP